jgi:hypothetical protein
MREFFRFLGMLILLGISAGGPLYVLFVLPQYGPWAGLGSAVVGYGIWVLMAPPPFPKKLPGLMHLAVLLADAYVAGISLFRLFVVFMEGL